MSFHHLEGDWNGILYGPRDTANSGQVCHTTHTWVQGNGRGNNLKGGRVSFILFLCDFYQNTEIQHTHKPAQKRSALFTATASACPPGRLPAGKGGGGVSHISREGKRGRKREENLVEAEKPRGK